MVDSSYPWGAIVKLLNKNAQMISLKFLRAFRSKADPAV